MTLKIVALKFKQFKPTYANKTRAARFQERNLFLDAARTSCFFLPKLGYTVRVRFHPLFIVGRTIARCVSLMSGRVSFRKNS